MSLIAKVQQVQDKSFDKWFDRWYEKENLEKEIIQAAQEGYTGYNINIKSYQESESSFGKERIYLNRRLRDKRTIDKLRTQLGVGFTVRHYKEIKTGKFFGANISSYAEGISIKWKGEAE